MRRTLLALVLTGVAAACSPSGDPADSPHHGALPLLMAAAAEPAGGASRVEEDDGVLEFAHAYPAAAGAIPALRALLDAERDRARAEARKDALEARASAEQDGYPFRPHALAIEWQVVADTPRFLSLSQAVYSFGGGAHGNHGSGALVWDRQAARRLAAVEMFASPAALRAAVRAPLCAGLDRERRRKGVEPPSARDPGPFPRCIDPVDDATIILGASRGGRFDRIGFLIDPYVAGPYAEGEYEVTLPVTAAVLGAVRPEYRTAFAAARQARKRPQPAL